MHRLTPLALVALVAACGSEPPVGTPTTTATEADGAASAAPEAAPAPAEAVRIMPLGDSITQGDQDHDSYRRPLWKSLEAEGYDVDFVGSLSTNHRGGPPRADFDRDHEGHWGWRVDEVLGRIRGWVSEHRPDILLVHLGSNDLFQREGVDSTAGELAELIDAVRETRPTTVFLLAQIIPTRNSSANGVIRELNARIPELAAAKSRPDSPVLVVDQYTGFDASRQTYDGVHPNADGEIHMSERWLRALAPLLTSGEGS